MSGLGLEPIQYLLLVEYIHLRQYIKSGERTTIQNSKIKYHAFDSLRPLLQNLIILQVIHMLLFWMP